MDGGWTNSCLNSLILPMNIGMYEYRLWILIYDEIYNIRRINCFQLKCKIKVHSAWRMDKLMSKFINSCPPLVRYEIGMHYCKEKLYMLSKAWWAEEGGHPPTRLPHPPSPPIPWKIKVGKANQNCALSFEISTALKCLSIKSIDT